MSINASKDQNRVSTLLAVSSSDGTTPVKIYGDPTTHRLLVDSIGGGGGGGSIASETPTGTVNNTNTSFTVANTPLWIVINGSVLFSGGGYSYLAGTITTDVPVGTGGSIQSVYSSGSSVASEVPTGTVDNSNVTFTVASTPVFIVVNGSTLFSGGGYTYLSGTITLDSPVGTGGSIYSVHN